MNISRRKKKSSSDPHLSSHSSLLPLSFSSSHLCFFISLRWIITVSPVSSLPPFPPSLSFLCSQFWAQKFLLIRESAEWNHRGVCSVLTLFIFLMPPYSLLHSGNEVELHTWHDCVCVCCLHACVCVYNKSELQWCGWENMTGLHWESGSKPGEGSVLYTVTTAARPHTVLYCYWYGNFLCLIFNVFSPSLF